MKKLLLIATTMFVALVINAQVSREQSSTTVDLYKGSNSISFTQFARSSDTTYALYFQNREYQHIVSLEYISMRSKKDAIDFLTIVLEVFESDQALTVTVGNQSIYMSKGLGGMYIAKGGAYFILTRRQAEEILKTLLN
jgi:hypothetical protein